MPDDPSDEDLLLRRFSAATCTRDLVFSLIPKLRIVGDFSPGRTSHIMDIASAAEAMSIPENDPQLALRSECIDAWEWRWISRAHAILPYSGPSGVERDRFGHTLFIPAQKAGNHLTLDRP